jgi:ribosomal protein L37AE/L43A
VYPTAEFTSAAGQIIRRRTLAVMSAVAAALLGACTALYVKVNSPLYPSEMTTAYGFVIATGIALLVAQAAGVGWWQARHPCLRCTHCRRRLTNAVPQVVASGCCHHCGRRVLRRPAEQPPLDALIPRAEFLNAHARYQQRTGSLMLAAVGATFTGCVVGGIILERLDLPDPLSRLAYLLLLMTAPVIMVLVLRWMTAGAKRDPALACPGCVKPLTDAAMLVAGTGHCFHCGCRAVPPRNRPLPAPHAGRWLTTAGLSEADRQLRRANRRALALVVAVCAAAVWVLSLGDLMWGRRPLMALGLDKAAADWVSDRVPLGVAVATVAAAVAASRAAVRGAKQSHPTDCPRCGKEVLPAFAVGTKCCNHCGWRVVQDAPATTSARRVTYPPLATASASQQ